MLPDGVAALQQTREVRSTMWQGIELEAEARGE